MNKPKKNETNSAALAAVTPATDAPPVNPAAILAARKRQQQVDGWQTARRLLLQPELSEEDVIELADCLSAANLDGRWIEPLRLAARMREENHTDREAVSELVREFRTAKDRAAAREEEIRHKIRELEGQLPGFGKNPTPELQEVSRIGEQLQRLQRMGNLEDALTAMFRPLFDPAATLADFALPRVADRIPPAIRQVLAQAGLLDDKGQPIALTEPPAPERQKPKPAAPVLQCGVGPTMALAAKPIKQQRRQFREVTIPQNYPQ